MSKTKNEICSKLFDSNIARTKRRVHFMLDCSDDLALIFLDVSGEIRKVGFGSSYVFE